MAKDKGKLEGQRGQKEKKGAEEEVEGGIKWEGRKEWQRLGEQRIRGDGVTEQLTSHSYTPTHTLHSLRKWLVYTLEQEPNRNAGWG